jgi:hypothetical protein
MSPRMSTDEFYMSPPALGAASVGAVVYALSKRTHRCTCVGSVCVASSRIGERTRRPLR